MPDQRADDRGGGGADHPPAGADPGAAGGRPVSAPAGADPGAAAGRLVRAPAGADPGAAAGRPVPAPAAADPAATGGSPFSAPAPDPATRGGRRVSSPVADRLARAAQALAVAQADARARGARPASANPRDEENGSGAQVPPADPLRTRPRRGDPQPLETAIGGLIRETGWEVPITSGSVSARWAEIVGADLAAHTVPDGLRDGELTVSADSTAWATQLRLLSAQLVRRLNAELGAGTVARVRVLGPSGPARRAGEWRVRGARGPRDTYG